MRELILPLAASLAINTLAMSSVQHAFTGEYRNFERIRREQRLAAEKDRIFFDFVESPALEPARKPVDARKISDRDSVSRDLAVTKPRVADGPKIKNPGPADQLAQLQRKPGQTPAPAVQPSQEMKKAPNVPPTPEAERPAAPAPKPKPSPEEKEARGPASKDEVVVPAPPKPEPPAQSPSKPSPVDSPKRAAAPAQDGRQGPVGRDRITTQEMAKTRQRGARLTGMTSFDAMGSDMGVYMKNLKEKVWIAWFPYLSFQYPTDYPGANAVLSIVIDREGDVKSVRVLESSGSPQFAEFCVTAVQRASNFGKLPAEVMALLGKDQIEIKFAFYYR